MSLNVCSPLQILSVTVNPDSRSQEPIYKRMLKDGYLLQTLQSTIILHAKFGIIKRQVGLSKVIH